jgi:serine/threonine protein kinase
MATDSADLMRMFGLRLNQRVQCYLEDTEHPTPASVVGYTRSEVVITVDTSTGQRWVVVDPGFLIRDVQQTQRSPTTPNASLSSTSSSALGYPQVWSFISKEYLAQGAQGQVHKCVTSDGRTVVTKEMKFAKSDMLSFQRQLDQARQIKNLRHNHLIQYLDVLETVDQSAATVTIITPFYNEKDLREFVQKQQLTIDEQHIASLILQVAGALDYLHTRNPSLVHRDVKPENILMCSGGQQALLMDLDTCKPATRSVTVGLGTMEYMAPEAMIGAATTKSDIWSLGVVMYVLAALPEFPTLLKNGNEVCLNESSWTDAEMRRAIIIAIGKRSRSYSRTFVDLILKMLRRDPSQRPSAAEVSGEITLALENILLGQVEPMNWDI